MNHNTTLKEIHEAVDRLPKSDYEFVRLDAFIHLVNKAHRQDLIDEELYPDKRQLRKMLAKDAEKPWASRIETIQKHAQRAELDEAAFRREVNDPKTRLALDRSATPPSDIVAFDAVWDSMHLVRLTLNLKGIYVNDKSKGVKDFLKTYGNVKDANLIQEMWMAWESWDEKPVSYATACLWARRLDALAHRLAVAER